MKKRFIDEQMVGFQIEADAEILARGSDVDTVSTMLLSSLSVVNSAAWIGRHTA